MPQYISYSSRNGGGGGVTLYANFAAFPVSASNGALALALDTDTLYAFNTTSMTWVVIGGAGSILGVGTIDSTAPSSNGAAVSANLLIMQSASGTVPGLVNTTTQTFAGNKTFTGSITASNLSGTNSGDVTLGTANGLSLIGQSLSLALSSTSTTGALSSTDWNTFNNKQAAGNYITALTGDVSATGPGSVASTVNSVGGSSAANVNSATLLALAATSSNTASAIVKRDASGGFAASSVLMQKASSVTGSSDAIQFSVFANATQTADILEVYDSGGFSILSINDVGRLYVQDGVQVGKPVIGFDGVFEYIGSVSGSLTIAAPSTITSYTVTWPNAQAVGTQFLQNDGAGNMSWTTPTGTGANTTLSNLTSPTAVNQDLLPNADATLDLGGTSFQWDNVYGADFYASGGFHSVAFDNSTGAVAVTAGAGDLNLSSVSDDVFLVAAGVTGQVNISAGNGIVDFDNGELTNLSDPTSGQSAATKNYVDNAINGSGVLPKVEYITLNGTNITAKLVALISTPFVPANTIVDIISVGPQVYGVDYIVVGSNVEWNGKGLDGFVVAGNILRVLYFV